MTGPGFFRTLSEVGRGIPLHCTAVGKALLMGANEAEVKRLATQGLERHSPNTVISLDGLLAEMRRCREQGYALDMEEFEPGARCLGAPIMDSDSKVLCAISVAGPATRMSAERLRALVPVVTRSAATVEVSDHGQAGFARSRAADVADRDAEARHRREHLANRLCLCGWRGGTPCDIVRLSTQRPQDPDGSKCRTVRPRT